MDNGKLKRIVELSLIRQLIENKQGYFVPVAISGRHVHVCQSDLETLFGRGYVLKKMRDLIQPGQYVCEESVTLAGPKGKIEKIRILGPVRNHTQAEISFTDCIKVGIKAPVRMSGELKGTPGGKLTGPAGEVTLGAGVIVSARHLHMSIQEAAMFGLKNGDIVSVKKAGEREIIFGNVPVRAGDAHALEMHIDTDEANAAMCKNGDLVEVIK